MKIAILGLGSIGSRHAQNLLSLGHEVVAYDPAPADEALTLFRIWGGKFTYTRDVIFFDRTIEACVIASPSSCHYQDIRDTIDAGFHIFIEKPIGLCSAKSIGDLLERAKEKKLKVFVGYMLRFHPAVIDLKNSMKHLGEPLWGSFYVAQKSTKPPYLKDGVIYNWSHEIDLALYLLGPASVSCVSKDQHIADICLEHDNGARSVVHLDYLTSPEVRVTTLAGTSGVAHINLVERTLNIDTTSYQCMKDFDGSYDDDYVEEIKWFLRWIEGSPPYGCTGAEAVEVLRICNEADK